MDLISTLNSILKYSLPFISNLIESKVVPVIKRKAYQKLDSFVDLKIQDLVSLLQKIEDTDDLIKRKAHIEGFILGVEALNAIGQKLLDASNTLKTQIEA